MVASAPGSLATPTNAASADLSVEAAFVLGWQVAELLNLQERPADPGSLALLPTVSTLPFATQCQVIADEIVAGLKKVGASTPSLSTTLAATVTVAVPGNGASRSTQLAPAAQAALQRLHLQLLHDLTVRDYRLGKSYSLGASLSETTLRAFHICISATGSCATTAKSVRELFAPDRVRWQLRTLADLKSSFQPYSVDAVAATLNDWGEWIQLVTAPDGKAELARAGGWPAVGHLYIYPQLTVWRALLSGEKLATDTLQVADYVNSVAHLVGQYWTVLRAFLRHPSTLLLIALPIVLLAAGGAGLYASHQLGAAYGAAIALLGFLGVSSATVVAAVRSAVAQTESHLWAVEVAGAVTLAIDHVPGDVPASAVSRLVSTRHETAAARTRERLRDGSAVVGDEREGG